jgi:hypothetical protein
VQLSFCCRGTHKTQWDSGKPHGLIDAQIHKDARASAATTTTTTSQCMDMQLLASDKAGNIH